MKVPAQHPVLPRMNVVLMVAFTLVTVGIYLPVWYLRRLRAFNALRSTVKVGPALPLAVLVLYLVRLGSPVVHNVFAALGASSVSTLLGGGGATLVGLAQGIVFLVLAFQVRDVLEDHLRAQAAADAGPASVSLQSQISFSGGWTFLFNAYYLQSKINQYHRELTSASAPEA
jgi:hypothetical protein